MRVKALKDAQLPKQAFHTCRSFCWYADVCSWAKSWDLCEHEWDTRPKKLRSFLHSKAIRKLWDDPSPRLQYVMRDVNPMVLYEEQKYLGAPI